MTNRPTVPMKWQQNAQMDRQQTKLVWRTLLVVVQLLCVNVLLLLMADWNQMKKISNCLYWYFYVYFKSFNSTPLHSHQQTIHYLNTLEKFYLCRCLFNVLDWVSFYLCFVTEWSLFVKILTLVYLLSRDFFLWDFVEVIIICTSLILLKIFSIDIRKCLFNIGYSLLYLKRFISSVTFISVKFLIWFDFATL